MLTTGLILHTYPLSRILLLSSTLATLSYTLAIFNQASHPTIFIFIFNTLITSLTSHPQNDQTHVAFSLYSRILTHTNLKPNDHTYPSLFKACRSHPWLQYGRALHTHVLKFCEPSYYHFVQASLLNFYSIIGKVSISRYLFDQVSHPDLATWNSILSAYARNASVHCVHNAISSDDIDNTGLSLEVLSLFNDMQKSLVRPNEVTMVTLIGACGNLGAFGQGTWAHAYVLKKSLKLNHYISTALIDFYANCGCLGLAFQLFGQLPDRDTLCYNAMIRGFAIHGHGNEALELFKKMNLDGLLPDDVTMVVIMCACSHVGLVDQGCKYFECMKEAEETVRTMPMKPNAILWRSLLGAARVHGNLEIGELALSHLTQLEPEISGNYVLLSNLSLVETNGAMHEFIIGDKTYPQLEEIYVKEEKEDALSYHSEWLAIAFALIASDSSSPIRIIKNLRRGLVLVWITGERLPNIYKVPTIKSDTLKLAEMTRRCKEYGHRPRTRKVIFGTEEEEKEDALSHIQRLAIPFGFIASGCIVPILSYKESSGL
ncbi:unnamed protein product [Ilex paraguariensis]|uniref:DYW domain-containing protein n=1 Tax=Ilex paraguariensis TaxID=185542 RepID=A0ABC8SDK9_9AQUA